ncbi:MAG TPA: GNAT family N-acetyltransferase [Micropepsaceae bacterium]|nr:GNAT family N-acetyltransferase [Micropepsaceae bacterium]
MTVPEIIVDEKPDPGQRQAIFTPLLNYNDSRVGPPTLLPFAVFLRDPNNHTGIGGLWAYSAYDWLFVELLFVPEAMRRHGIGSKLMRHAEDVALKRSCAGIWLDIYSFQARGFYEKLGYEIFGALDDFPKGHTRYFFRKLL